MSIALTCTPPLAQRIELLPFRKALAIFKQSLRKLNESVGENETVQTAISDHAEEVLTALHSNSFSVNSIQEHLSLSQEELDLKVQTIISTRKNPDHRSSEQLSAIKKLFNKGANPSYVTRNSSFLHTAIENKDYDLLKFLLLNAADPELNTIDGVPLRAAIDNNDSRALEILLNHGANINTKVISGRDDFQSALGYAQSKQGSEGLVALLNQYGGS